MKFKNTLSLILFTFIIGSISGLIIWCFIKVMNTSIYYIWDYIPKQINFPYYTLTVCSLFGLLTGVWKSRYGLFPEELEEVVVKIKKNGRYEYNKIKSSIISSLLPLIGGASIGPESGLVGIIAGLCTWTGDRLKYFYNEVNELATIGFSATIGTIFASPLFGFALPLENDEETIIPKRSKIILYFISIISSIGVFTILNNIFNNKYSIEQINGIILENINFFHIILLTICGIILGFVYFASKKILIKIMKPIKGHIFIRCTLAGIILGIIGTILPLTMFSGEEQISIILKNGKEIGFLILLLTGLIKIILTNICIESDLNGGHFFPLIFSGLSIGYSLSTLLNIDPVLSMAIVTTSLLSHTLKKPIATILLLMIIFPPKLMIIMLGVSIISSLIRTPKLLKPVK